MTTWNPHNIDIAVGGVCTTCNNVVLGDLENHTFNPLLKRISLKAPVTLDIDDQATLIAWITRFVMVADISYAGKESTIFTAEERKQFIDTFLPQMIPSSG